MGLRPATGKTGATCHDHRVEPRVEHRASVSATRRAVLRFGAVAGFVVAGGTAGCGLRLERDAPNIPLVPAAEAHPAEANLRAELATVRAALAAATSFVPPPGPTAALVQMLRNLHAEQESVLRDRLRQVRGRDPLGEPETFGGPSPATPPGTATAARGTSAAAAPAAAGPLATLLAAEGTGIGAAARGDLARVPDSDRALVGALLAQRGVAWLRLGPSGDAVGLGTAVAAVPGPDGRSLLPDPGWTPAVQLTLRLAPAAAAARYGAEVIAARSAAAQGPAARAGLAALADHAARLREAARAAGRPGAAELGFSLPFRVATADDVARLARHIWTGWARSVASALVPAVASAPASEAGADLASDVPTSRDQPHGEPGEGDAAALVGWLVEAELMRQRWAAPAVPFPGLHWDR